MVTPSPWGKVIAVKPFGMNTFHWGKVPEGQMRAITLIRAAKPQSDIIHYSLTKKPPEGGYFVLKVVAELAVLVVDY